MRMPKVRALAHLWIAPLFRHHWDHWISMIIGYAGNFDKLSVSINSYFSVFRCLVALPWTRKQSVDVRIWRTLVTQFWTPGSLTKASKHSQVVSISNSLQLPPGALWPRSCMVSWHFLQHKIKATWCPSFSKLHPNYLIEPLVTNLDFTTNLQHVFVQ